MLGQFSGRIVSPNNEGVKRKTLFAIEKRVLWYHSVGIVPLGNVKRSNS